MSPDVVNLRDKLTDYAELSKIFSDLSQSGLMLVKVKGSLGERREAIIFAAVRNSRGFVSQPNLLICLTQRMKEDEIRIGVAQKFDRLSIEQQKIAITAIIHRCGEPLNDPRKKLVLDNNAASSPVATQLSDLVEAINHPERVGNLGEYATVHHSVTTGRISAAVEKYLSQFSDN